MSGSMRYGWFDGPVGVGRLLVAGDGEGLRAVEFEAGWKGRGVGADWVEDDGAGVVREACGELRRYFEGMLQGFGVPIVLDGTGFEAAVWEALRGIGFGEVISYGEQARRMGRGAESARAVGAANGRNPVAIIVPCHRVVGGDGKLVGFGGGVEVKRWLLDHERRVCGDVGLFEGLGSGLVL